MLLGKEPSKFEVYNDIEGELVNFFRIVKNRPAELLLELDLLPLNSREEFASWLHFHDGGNEPNIHLPDQLEIIDRTTPASLTEEAEKLKTSLRKRSDYRDVRQAAAYLMRVRNSYPTLDKTLRESKDDTGKHNGSGSITDGYADTGTASDGDSVDYQIISTLPSITSASTYLTCYTFADTLSRGITYNKHDVVLEFFTDAACTDPVAKWAETDGKFTVTYSTTDTGESGMTIEMTADGLKEMNTSKAVYSDASMVNSGYSDCTLRITYATTVNSSADVVYGDNGNPNEVVLTWKRTSQNSYDTLKDDAKVFAYGLELTKLFSDGKGDFSKVQFIMQNKTDGYYVKAKLDEATGVYYVTSHVTDKKDATRFVPIAKDGKGKILIKGLEDDEYTVTEIKTADGYTLLKKGIAVVISRKDASASAAVDGKQAAMLADNGSANALVPLSVVNTSGFDLPATGDRGVWMYGLAGILLMTASAACIIIARKRFK